jgi:hypothetical protein
MFIFAKYVLYPLSIANSQGEIMPNSDASGSITTIIEDYAALLRQFDAFSKNATSQSEALGAICVGQPNPSYGEFSIKIAGHTLFFILTSFLDSDKKLMGAVECYQEKKYPHLEKIKLGRFTFNPKGDTSERELSQDIQLSIEEEADALYLILPFIKKSLA